MQHQGNVSHEIRGQIMLIGLDRAEKRNAFDSQMIHELSLALTEYEDHAGLRCAVIFAHGEHFTAGLDLAELQPKLASGVFDFAENQINPWGTGARKRAKPVIAAVQGYCFTAGIELMLNADLVIAQDNCQFAQMEVQRGILPFGGATVRFVQAAGWAKAMRFLLTGERFSAQAALEMNLINEITEAPPLSRAIELAEQICRAARLQQHLQPLLRSEDAQEGVMAMLQRRDPKFQGK